MRGLEWLNRWSLTRKVTVGILLVMAAAGVSGVMGVMGGKPPVRGPGVVEVKAITLAPKDTPITYEYVGEVEAWEEAQIRPKVTGNITEKFVLGGSAVKKGQPLFRLEQRQYETAVLAAQANLAESEAVLMQVRRDVERYKVLAAHGAVSKQALDNYLAQESQNIAKVEANRAKLRQAQLDLDDTVIVSPIDGRIDIKEVSIGNYAQAGQTILATVSSVESVRVKFSMSENEYLRVFAQGKGMGGLEPGRAVRLLLSDGREYGPAGEITQVDSNMSQGSGSMLLKAVFANPQKLLLPGMFGRVTASGEIRKGALVVPQRAVQEMLGKYFVTVIGEGDKAESRPVKVGPRVGSGWVVEEGLKAGDRIVVEGGTKAMPGTQLKAAMIDG